jgi:hypothetical protein
MTVVRFGLARAVALLSFGLLAAGCTVVTGGKAEAPTGLTPRSLTGDTVRQVLLGDTALSRVVQEPFVIDSRIPPRFGGPEALEELGSALPVDCLGVAEMLHQSVYPLGQVTDVAVENWRHATTSAKLTGIKEGVVSLPTAADANALFAKFSQQWARCNGRAVVLPDPVFKLKANIADVQIAPALLSSTVSIALNSKQPDQTAIPAGRAIGVRGNCVVEVEVDFFNMSTRSMQESDGVNATAESIAKIMMDRISELS